MELIHLVMRQDIGLQLGRAAQRVAVDLQHLLQRHGILPGVEVAGIGKQELECVADAPVGVHHTRQDLVVTRDVARIVAGGNPQADDLGAEFFPGLLRIDAIAQALAHLAALAVDREAVGQQAAIRRAADHRTGRKQRGVEPAAVLIVAFQVQVGLWAGSTCARVDFFMPAARMRALEHGGVGGARVEPDLEDIAALGVGLGVLLTDDGFRRGLAPGFDAAGLHHGRGLVQDFHRARMQFTRVPVDKKRQGHAPAALAADTPVGPASDHVVQARLAVFRVEGGLFDGFERYPAQGFGRLVPGENSHAFVHANKPLRGGAVDHGCLVAPAMRVAVLQFGGGKQAVRGAQRVDDFRHRLPDIEPTEQGQLGRITAVSLHRVQDALDGQAMGHATVEVFHAVSR